MTMDEIDEKIEALHVHIREGEALLQQTKEAVSVVHKIRRRCLSSQQQLAETRAKADNYQTISWEGAVDGLMGKRHTIRQSLHRAYVEARQHHQENLRRLEAAEVTAKALQNQQAPFEEVTTQYQHLLEQKEALILQCDHSKAHHLRELIEQQTQLEAMYKKQQQTLAAGTKALAYLKRVSIRLKKAEAFKPVSGNNQNRAIDFWIKQMKASLPYAKKAHKHMRKCQSNLNEVGADLTEALSQNGFLAAAEMTIMKNGMFRISLVLDQCENAQAYVESAVARCQKRIESTETELHQLKMQYRTIVEQA